MQNQNSQVKLNCRTFCNQEGLKAKSNQAPTHAELIQLAFAESVCRAGIPRDWVECDVRSVADGGLAGVLQICLIMRSRNAQLIHYTLALQIDIIKRLNRYQPSVDFADMEWVWKFAKECHKLVKPLPQKSPYAQSIAGMARNKHAAIVMDSDEQHVATHAPTIDAHNSAQVLRNIFSHL